MSLSKSYKIAALYPFTLTLLAGIVLAITHDGSGYKSEWFTDDGFNQTVFCLIVFSGVLSVLSLSIYFNDFQSVRNSKFFSFLTWMIPAGLLCLAIISIQLRYLTTTSEVEMKFVLRTYIICIPVVHLFFLLFSYWNYRTKLEKN
jgi:hypothetical protein